MKTWMLPWLFPVGLLGAVVFVVVTGGYAPLIAVTLGVLLVPVLWRVRVHPAGDGDTKYWRIKAP
jgi:hypothetical protein